MNRERAIEKLIGQIRACLDTAEKAKDMRTRHVALTSVSEKAEKAARLNLESQRWTNA